MNLFRIDPNIELAVRLAHQKRKQRYIYVDSCSYMVFWVYDSVSHIVKTSGASIA